MGCALLVALMFVFVIAATALMVAQTLFVVAVTTGLVILALLLPGIIVGFVQALRDAGRSDPE